MTSAARHARPSTLDGADVLDLAEELEDTVQSLGTSTTVFGLALSEALMQVQARRVIDPKASEPETWRATVWAMQVGHAAFAAAATTEGIVECRIIDEVRSLPATGPQFYANAGNWLTVFWFAVIFHQSWALKPVRLQRVDPVVHVLIPMCKSCPPQSKILTRKSQQLLPGIFSRTSPTRRSIFSTIFYSGTMKPSTPLWSRRCNSTRPTGPLTQSGRTTLVAP
ncbi:hypothetical protein GCM10022403_071350 [Streptomyces coacervatus]|uniref:Uncharacterized protein n=1 Tax=Streptomyces coacervatus TaxID=647381 RepID=A0ABP7IV94_9ACTN